MLDRLEGETEEVRRAVVESHLRLATEVVALAGIMKDVRDGLLAAGQTRMNLFEERLVRLEQRLALGPACSPSGARHALPFPDGICTGRQTMRTTPDIDDEARRSPKRSVSPPG